MDALITTEELAEILDSPGIRIVDGSYMLAADGQGRAGAVRISGAVDFDIDDIADPDADFPHMLPDAALFSKKLGALGISENDHVIVYARENTGLAACRVWWMLRVFGHKDVQVLDGGLQKWLRENRPVTEEIVAPKVTTYRADFQLELVVDADAVAGVLEDTQTLILDARDNFRFENHGHIPGSVNLPYADFFDGDGCFRSLEECRALIARSGVDGAERIIASCGSGVTACVTVLALYRLGRKDVAVYDGSWTEWGAYAHLPKQTGVSKREICR